MNDLHNPDCHQKPLILVNFKTVEEGSGRKALALAKELEEASLSISDFEIILTIQTLDLYQVVHNTSLKVFAQHVDPIGYGAFTGGVNPFAVKAVGAVGTLINHNEKRIPEDSIEEAVRLSRAAGLMVVLCASNVIEAKNFIKYEPDYIAIEPLDSDVVSSLNLLDLVKQSAAEIDSPRLLFGGGIASYQEVKQIMKEGASGIMISSIVMKSSDPNQSLLRLLKPGKQFVLNPKYASI